MLSPLQFASELIEFDSVSSKTNVPVTEHVAQWLRGLHFELERIDYVDAAGVPKANLIGKLGSGLGGMAYFCHTDVVPVNNWSLADHGPFQPVVRDGRLYGRGSTDMKGSLACMLAAVEAMGQRPLREPVYICCTADEEVGMHGAEIVARESRLYREIVAGQSRSIVGEPTRFEVIYGHKGGCGLKVTSRGKAAHSSTNRGINANWRMIPFLQQMKELYEELESSPEWRNEEFDPPTTSLNLGINDHNPGINVTSAQSICTLYFRAMPGMNVEPILTRIRSAAEACGLEYHQGFRATPFYRQANSPFIQECLDFAEVKTPHTVSYGTDAARFGELQNCVIMGPGDIAQAHTSDEWVSLADLDRGVEMYGKMLERWCL
ncbi:M20 family metallopeptidase [Planctomicrobium piriforme]|uniref:Acetylornithine deacetylase n=1 Tax=Planctomicrobium piriforme TaxID=1576369 RepID=A0A1I3S898_9PLAN|nr:M20 family metallopeptidase [Planctomicrobium piriforme]SFJ53746.1 acetylornithine deacetylase [Planctomicrobium piriforme]